MEKSISIKNRLSASYLMEQKRPFFSIIIPTYKRPMQLAACLQSLAHLDYPRDHFEVIVVDDGGAVPLEAIVSRFNNKLDVTLLRERHAGPAAARNTGAARAKGELLAYIGDDCRPSSEWLATLEGRFSATPHCAVGGRVVNTLPDNAYSSATQLLIDYLYRYYNALPDQARFFTPNNLTLPTNSFRAMGGFDPSFTRGSGEDREFCDRWLNHGYRMIYAPEVLVYHTHPLTFSAFLKQHFRYGCGSVRYHVTRAQRRSGQMELEPAGFYINLLRYPLSGTREKKKLRLVLLLGIAQVANAAGFFWEIKRKIDRN
jgi:glycosyltransferase involved in cell wall biosynthesis